jgi:hypothetical protein
MLSQEAIQKILGIKDKVSIAPEEMAKEMKVAFYPISGKEVGGDIEGFESKLKSSFERLGVAVADYNESLERVPLSKRVSRVFKVIANNLRYVSDCRRNKFDRLKVSYLFF